MEYSNKSEWIYYKILKTGHSKSHVKHYETILLKHEFSLNSSHNRKLNF